MTHQFFPAMFAHQVDLEESTASRESFPEAAFYRFQGQDGNFPFLYEPATDSYIGYRWDFNDVGNGMRRPLTQKEVETLTGIYLTPHPYFYRAYHLACEGRLTKVWFKKPNVLLVPSTYGIVEESWSKNGSDPAHFHLTEVGKKQAAYGYDGYLVMGKSTEAPEALILDPKKYITGAIWQDFLPGQLMEYNKHNNALQAADLAIQTAAQCGALDSGFF